eukprot:2063451-Rhodomonas_salina.2
MPRTAYSTTYSSVSFCIVGYLTAASPLSVNRHRHSKQTGRFYHGAKTLSEDHAACRNRAKITAHDMNMLHALMSKLCSGHLRADRAGLH